MQILNNNCVYLQFNYNILTINKSKTMKQDIVNQYTFKINDFKLKQDLKILSELKYNFQSTVDTQQRILQKQFLYFCTPYSSKDKKKQFDACNKFNSRIIEKYKNFASEIKNQIWKSSNGCAYNLKSNAHNSYNKQGFYTLIGLQQQIDRKIQTLKDQALRAKAGRFTLNDMAA